MTAEGGSTANRAGWRPLSVLMVFIAGAGGILVGARWHDKVETLVPAIAVAGAPAASASQPGQLWTCGMHPQVIQDHPGLCPICHMELTPLKVGAGSSDGSGSADQPAPQAGERKIKYWWDPMYHPPYISDKPGKSPMGMDLVPVYEDEGPAPAAGGVTIDPAVVQNMGIRTATVTEGPLERSIRAVGYLEEAQPMVRDINLRVSGWIRRLHAATEGQHLEAGDPLFDLYSPEIQVAVEELIASRRARAAAPESASRGVAELYEAASRKLQLFGLDNAQVQALAGLDRAPDTVTFTSPAAGDVTEKPVVEGAAVKAGDRVLRIVDHRTLWLDARVFEKDLPLVRVGAAATVEIPSLPGSGVTGEVVFIHPHLDPATRTGLARIAVPNPDLLLRPAMYATVRLRSRMSDLAVLVPREAVIDTGESQVAFVSLGQGRFEPREVRTGMTTEGGLVQVMAGLSPGEEVVSSGQFLIDSESRLREAVRAFLGQRLARGAEPSAPSPADLTRAAGAPGALQAAVDQTVSAYLDLSAALGAEQTTAEAIDITPLSDAAAIFRKAAAGSHYEPGVAALERALTGMAGRPADAQRDSFRAVSQQVIALVEALPPSRSVAERLYLMDCPMAPGNWLQRTPDIANPFYGSDMKQCGTVLRTITPPAGAGR